MAQAARLNLRMQKELKLLLADPPPGALFPFLSADSDLPSLSSLDAQLEGPEGTVYAKGVFNLKIQIPERYPFHPPIVTFTTPIYHPNIDTGGRICLDILNLPPKGAWQPSLNISTVLTSIGLLLSEPNPDDGLMCDVSREYKYNRQAFDQKARAMTEKYANAGASGHGSSRQCEQSNSDLRTMMEVGGSDKVPKTDLADFVSSQVKPGGISKKLSLDFSSSTIQREKNREENGHLPWNPETELESKGWSKESRNVADKYSHEYKKQCGIGRKLSLGSFVQTPHRKDGNEMGEMLSKASNSICNPQTTFMTSWGLSPEQLGDCHGDSDQHPLRSVCGSKTICPEKPSPISNTMPSVSFDEHPSTRTDEKKIISMSELSTSQSCTDMSSGLQPPMLPVNCIKVESREDCGVWAGDVPVDSMLNKVSMPRKKLSLGLKGSSQGPGKVDKENLVPISVTSPAKKTVTGQKLSVGPLTRLQGSNDDNSQLLLQTQHFITEVSKKQQPNQLQIEKVAEENQQGQETSPEAESIIVLDSEDSEEENNGSIRSKSLLSRKRALKRRA